MALIPRPAPATEGARRSRRLLLVECTAPSLRLQFAVPIWAGTCQTQALYASVGLQGRALVGRWSAHSHLCRDERSRGLKHIFSGVGDAQRQGSMETGGGQFPWVLTAKALRAARDPRRVGCPCCCCEVFVSAVLPWSRYIIHCRHCLTAL